MKKTITLTTIFLSVLLLLSSCCSSNHVYTQDPGPESGFTRSAISHLDGFGKERRQLLRQHGLKRSDFVRLSTDSAWHLSADDRQLLHAFRISIPKPDSTILLQKVISLEKLEHFRANDAKGIIEGFVAVAADVKKLKSLPDVYGGLRLDYEGTPYDPVNGAGYAVVRFYSRYADELRVPFCQEMGGPDEHAWPCGGGGFTTSWLGDGGFPEWFFDKVHEPKEGAEIYASDPKGNEHLVLVYRQGKWVEP